jgi:hypothetical protein
MSPLKATEALRPALAAACLLAAVSCAPWSVPPSLVGTWTGTQQVTVRVRQPRGASGFVSDTVAIALTIRADGSVAGRVGGTELVNSYVLQNRGWFGRLIHVATDYRIEGRLQGALFAADPVPTKDVRAPFDVRGDSLIGSLFQLSGMGVYPMVDLRLARR